MQEGDVGESTEDEDGGIKNMEYVKAKHKSVKKLKKRKVEVSDTDTEMIALTLHLHQRRKLLL